MLAEFECYCDYCHVGVYCETLKTACDSNPCLKESQCVNFNECDYYCVCEIGWSGRNCDLDFDECDSFPCQNGGFCKSENVGLGDSEVLAGLVYFCECEPGYAGVHCEIDVNECESNPCRNGATCFDEENGWRCECVAGWYAQCGRTEKRGFFGSFWHFRDENMSNPPGVRYFFGFSRSKRSF